MNFLKKLGKRFSARPDNTPIYWLNVQCNHCGEQIKVRVNLHNDLSIRYGENEQGDTYFCRKVVVGSSGCYRPIEVELTFNSGRKLVDRQVKGGKFVG